MNFYAIGFKGWVEIRKARVAPKRHITTVVHEGTIEVRDDFYWGKMKEIPTKTTLKSIFHEGGQVVASFPANKLGNAVPRIRVGTCKKLTAGQVQLLELRLGKTFQ